MSASSTARHAARQTAALAAAGLLVAAVLGFFAWGATLELPPGALSPANIASVRVLAADGSLLREVLSRQDGRARWVVVVGHGDLDRQRVLRSTAGGFRSVLDVQVRDAETDRTRVAIYGRQAEHGAIASRTGAAGKPRRPGRSGRR